MRLFLSLSTKQEKVPFPSTPQASCRDSVLKALSGKQVRCRSFPWHRGTWRSRHALNSLRRDSKQSTFLFLPVSGPVSTIRFSADPGRALSCRGPARSIFFRSFHLLRLPRLGSCFNPLPCAVCVFSLKRSLLSAVGRLSSDCRRCLILGINLGACLLFGSFSSPVCVGDMLPGGAAAVSSLFRP